MTAVVLSCEHASPDLPPEFSTLFDAATLNSHRGWDPGALDLAQALAQTLEAPLFSGRWSRLLIDLNRSAHHLQRVPAKARLHPAQCATLHAETWLPFRRQVADAVAAAIRHHGHCVHLSVHSFTPVWQGRRRHTQLGVLYDPNRAGERALAVKLKAQLAHATGLRVHRNQPYRGVADGHTTALRRNWGAPHYLGVEVEISQALVGDRGWPTRCRAICRTIAGVLAPEAQSPIA